MDKASRPCWGCGKPGHVASNCPEGRLNAIEGDEEAREDSPFLGCLACEVHNGDGDKWATVPRRSGKPLPVDHTMGLHIERAINMKNRFKALELESESGSDTVQ